MKSINVRTTRPSVVRGSRPENVRPSREVPSGSIADKKERVAINFGGSSKTLPQQQSHLLAVVQEKLQAQLGVPVSAAMAMSVALTFWNEKHGG